MESSRGYTQKSYVINIYMPEGYYLNSLYPFQDEILLIIQQLEVDFYLSGGTALSRCYLNHRYSDDLDLFVNNHPKFKQQCEIIVNYFKSSPLDITVSTASETFVRIFLEKEQLNLKVDFINDVSFHYGSIEKFELFNRVDNWRNILSNKICALSRMEPKDYADIFFIAKKFSFDWLNILEEAGKKDLWVEPIEVSRLINEFQVDLLIPLKWETKPDMKQIKKAFYQLHQDIFFGKQNSLMSTRTNRTKPNH
ncbi:MAG: nucleotidyl transferase AbiEii/AbiGii toxin family protein [Thermodesulfobacteriota bacterium]|nr:nucleotidyl transferase AbiEii/AbiGii toxin family protein [Thermodesulfobacteriota bacterium]